MHKRNHAFTPLGLALALCACDSLADEQTHGPALGQVRGTLRLAEGEAPPEGELQVSVLWDDASPRERVDLIGACGGAASSELHVQNAVLEQRLSLDTDFPAAFTLELFEPPPIEALLPRPDMLGPTHAIGELVVYRDVNENGQLDPSDLANESPDEVYGWGWGPYLYDESDSVEYTIEYWPQATDGTGDGHLPGVPRIARSAGYNLIKHVRPSDPTGVWDHPAPLDGQTQVELELAHNPYVQRVSCAETCQVTDERECPDDPNDFIPADATLLSPIDGESAWQSQDREHAVGGSTECLLFEGADRQYELAWLVRFEMEGCVTLAKECFYERSELPEGIESPCEQYMPPAGGVSEKTQEWGAERGLNL